jgi:hypothetical protein
VPWLRCCWGQELPGSGVPIEAAQRDHHVLDRPLKSRRAKAVAVAEAVGVTFPKRSSVAARSSHLLGGHHGARPLSMADLPTRSIHPPSPSQTPARVLHFSIATTNPGV